MRTASFAASERVGGEEHGAVQPLVGGEVGEDVGVRHVAPFGVERVLHALEVGKRARDRAVARTATTARHAGSVS